MRLENLTCTYEQSNRLMELGVRPIAPLRHLPNENKVGLLNNMATINTTDSKPAREFNPEEHLPAFTLGELLGCIERIFEFYEPSESLKKKYEENGKTMSLLVTAIGAADILIDALETKQISLELVNERIIDFENSIVTK